MNCNQQREKVLKLTEKKKNQENLNQLRTIITEKQVKNCTELQLIDERIRKLEDRLLQPPKVLFIQNLKPEFL
jgi:hypothetical protein